VHRQECLCYPRRAALVVPGAMIGAEPSCALSFSTAAREFDLIANPYRGLKTSC